MVPTAPAIEGDYIPKAAPLRPASALYAYQRECVLHMLYHDRTMLWLQMGLGKTAITLTAIVDRMRAGQVKKTLVFGPLRVIHAVWEREARKWEHTQSLRFSVMHGDSHKRLRALYVDADIYLCNYENMNWLAEALTTYYLAAGKPLPFEFVVYDEISKLKNSTSLRMAGGKRDRTDRRGEKVPVQFVGWKKIVPHFQYATGLTGSPASNGYIDLHGQFLAIDGGERLGEYITHYRDSYFVKWDGWSFTATEAGKALIESKISDITIKMDTREYLDLPPRNVRNIMVELPAKARRLYDAMEKEMFAELDNGRELEVFQRTGVTNKCLQICNGAAYVTETEHDEAASVHLTKSEWEAIHDAKLSALEDVLEEANGAPVLVAYSFIPDAERIMKKFGKKFNGVDMRSVKARDTEKVIDDWNRGRIGFLLGHPASMGHGLDGLQDSGCILAFFGLVWSLELYEQIICRLDRPGQKSPVSVLRILCEDTVDLAVADSLHFKDEDQTSLKNSIDRYRRGQVNKDLSISFL